MECKIDSINNMLKKLGKEEQDRSVRNFFYILSQFSGKNYFRNILIKILEKRPKITEEHLAYLIYISLQRLTNFDYDEKTQKEKLRKDLIKHSDKIIEFCQIKYASTNVVERYGLLQIILAMLNKKCRVIDLGTSIGIGLMSLNTNSFLKIKTSHMLKNFLRKKALLKEVIGVDIQKPDLKWQLSCYLPEEKKYRDKLKKNYNQLKKKGTKTTLLKSDIIRLEKAKLPKADVIWTSNILYQIEENIDRLKTNIKNLLGENGVWINADYRYENKKFATRRNPYVAMVRIKNKWNKILEVLESPSDVVRVIKPGKDFKKFKSVCGQIPANG